MTSETPRMSEFKAVVSDFGQLSSLALKGVFAAPCLDLWLKIGPPPARAIAVLASLAEFLTVVWGFHFWSNLSRRRLNTRIRFALGLFCVGLASTLFLVTMFTESPGEGRDRVVKGLAVREDVQHIIGPTYSPEQALKDSEYDPTAVWTQSSIAFMRVILTIAWLVTFASLAGYLTGFILQQRRRYSD
jgi:hypothetical protein